MHATHLLDSHFSQHCQAIHQKRRQALMTAVTALMTGRKLSVTGLGRAICNGTKTKHNIKRVDRLVGNPALHQERLAISRALARLMMGRWRRPVLIVDWSDLSTDREFQLLRASIPVGGRALTLYEEVHRQQDYGSPWIHERFLQRLQTVLPAHCCPIVVTDAGFRGPWFRAVQARGWDFIGRVGGHTMVTPSGRDDWVRVEHVFETATRRGRYLGPVDLVRRQPLTCQAYLLRQKSRGRIRKTVFGHRCEGKHSQKNAHRERTPWLLVTSLPRQQANTRQVIRLYKTRMQIEEAFRDLKNRRWGFSLDEARCGSSWRYENLLLIGQLAMVAIWLIGHIAELKQWHRSYQANTVHHTRVLSTFFLGLQVIKGSLDGFKKSEFTEAIKRLRRQATADDYDA